ncbi:TM2 domain-containing protein [Salinispora arenicola]|nr:TM2 domain-containing protein [Salinispora arenicola]NIL59895.1 TM2 domain-containing protein [Salinispora arenicola]NIL64580.1 TM2 domain-containing protein [Salinispora arenicola]
MCQADLGRRSVLDGAVRRWDDVCPPSRPTYWPQVELAGCGSLLCRLMTTPLNQPGYPMGVSDKSKVVAGVLQILLGAFGVGRFYMGDIKIGVIQLIVTLVTCGVGGIWGVIDGILILVKGGVDGQGRPLRD